MSWFDKLIPPKIKSASSSKSNVPEGLWVKCNGCDEVLYRQELTGNLEVCPKCGHHHDIVARVRLQNLFDNGDFEEIGNNLKPVDMLKFRDTKKYRDRISESQKKSGEKDALVAGKGTLSMRPVVIAVFEYKFMGGSMGSVVGERFARAVDEAIKAKCPFICVAASGGARMQESLFSLMQMAKTSASLTELADAGLPYISVLTNPTMGGVSASFAMLGDIIIAEPNALIGFAGPRVIESTVREKLPEGFQRSEFLLEHGAIDLIVSRVRMKKLLARLVAQLTKAEHLPVAGHLRQQNSV